MQYIVISLLAYIIGMFPTALIVVYLVTGKDVRSSGSKNMGALNTFRRVKKEKNFILGFISFFIVWVVDMAKAVFSVYIAQQMFGMYDVLGITLATFFSTLGHNYPIILKFQGGRGAASLMGVMIYFNPPLFIVWNGIIFICMIVFELFLPSGKKRQSLKSLVVHATSEQILGRLVGESIAVIPFFLYGGILFYPVFAGTLLILLRHRTRLINQFKNKLSI